MPCGAGAWRWVAVRRGKQSDRPLPTGTRTEPAKKRSLTADRGGDPGSSRAREGLRLTEEHAERWQPIVQQRAEAYVSKRANTLKGADAEVFYDAGIDAVARAIAAYKGDPKGLDAYIGRAISNAFNTTATKLGKNQTASLDESIREDGSQTRGDTLPSNDLSPEDAAIMKVAKARLAAWLQSLSDIDRKILALTKAGKTLREPRHRE